MLFDYTAITKVKSVFGYTLSIVPTSFSLTTSGIAGHNTDTNPVYATPWPINGPMGFTYQWGRYKHKHIYCGLSNRYSHNDIKINIIVIISIDQ